MSVVGLTTVTSSAALRDGNLRAGGDMADTTIRRSIGGTIAAGAGSLAAGALAVAGIWNGNWWGLVPAIVAVVLGGVAVVGPRKANCPHCGRAMSADGHNVNHCSACGQYAQEQGGALVKLAADYVDINGVFPVHLDRLIKPGVITGLPRSDMGDVRWPNICVVCSAPATGADLTEVLITRISGPVKTGLRLRFPFPRCARHPIHAEMTESGAWNGDGFACDHAQLRFQSYRFWREFCRLNGIDQRRAGLPS